MLGFVNDAFVGLAETIILRSMVLDGIEDVDLRSRRSMSSREDAFVKAMDTANRYVCAYEGLVKRLKEVYGVIATLHDK